jgi:cytidylate kinase
MGKEVAEKAARRLDYECLSRDVLLEASDKFNIPEIKLIKAIIDTPSILSRFNHGQQKYIAYIQSALTRHACQDEIVYHGLAGHVLLKNISHVLKVCITADFSNRVSVLMDREHISEKEASAWITKVDKERRKWTQTLYGIDPWDLHLYDLVININKYEVDDAVDLIYQSAQLEPFRTTERSQRAMEDLAMACEIKAALVDSFPDLKVASSYGNIILYGSSNESQARKLQSTAEERCAKIEGINNIEVHAGVSPGPDAI